MRTKYIYRVLPVFTILCACRSEAPQEITESTCCLMVKASISGADNTRTQITYGNPDHKQEIFSWTEGDEIFLYNMSQFNEFPDEACFKIEPNFGKSANFVFAPGANGHAKEFKVSSGDTILAFYGGDTNRVKYKKKPNDTIVYPDERNLVRISVGAESTYPQYIVNNPDDSYMSYMQENLKMYDIVTVITDDEIPDLHFKHLSAILRISLRNETGIDIFPTKLEYIYPTTSLTAQEGEIVNLAGETIDRNPSFFATSLYCSVETNENNEPYLKVCDSDFFTKNSPPYTESISSTINGKVGTADAGESIKNGESYELYLSAVPRLGNDSSGETLYINLVTSHDTDHPYSIAISNFNTIIEAGKRYWFNLTATPAGNLVLTSQYNPEDYKTNGSSGEENKEESGEENGGETTPEN